MIPGDYVYVLEAGGKPAWARILRVWPSLGVADVRWEPGVGEAQVPFEMMKVIEHGPAPEVGLSYPITGRLAALAHKAERIERISSRVALYWAGPNRQYRMTRAERETGVPSCPKCCGGMRKTTYKMEEGARHALWCCPSCLFLVRRDDVIQE